MEWLRFWRPFLQRLPRLELLLRERVLALALLGLVPEPPGRGRGLAPSGRAYPRVLLVARRRLPRVL